MKEEIYVDRLFMDYENTPDIKDFKEEIVVNLKERIKELKSKGLDENEAFDKATAELGDITTIADDVGKKKRNETIGQMYMKTKIPLTKRTAAGWTIALGLFLFGVGLASFAVISQTNNVAFYSISIALFSISCGMCTYFGLTQETLSHYAMKGARAFMYGIVCLIGLLGAGLAAVSFLSDGLEMSISFGFKLAAVLLAICTFVYLLATESNRHKPWVKAMVERNMEDATAFHSDIVDPAKSAKFGVASVGLWVLAIAMFMTLGLAIGWEYSWLVFLFALAIQAFMVTTIFVS